MRKIAFLFSAVSLIIVSCTNSPQATLFIPDTPVQWVAQWIGAPWDGDEFLLEIDQPAPEFKKEFAIDKKLKSATVHVVGLGFFELYLNGNKVGNEVFSPNETSWDHRSKLPFSSIPLDDSKFRNFRTHFLSYDVTQLINKGNNEISALVGNGIWATNEANWVEPYGTPRFICQLELQFKDGSSQIVASDTSWQVRRSPIVMNDVFNGEIYDSRLENPDASSWLQAVERRAPTGALEPQAGLPDRIMEVLEPKTITLLDDGRYEVDFGDYITGWVRISDFTAPEGAEISIEFPIECAGSGEWKYICNGAHVNSYAPRFCWWAFQKAIVSGWPGELKPQNICAEVVYTDLEVNGHFECSDTLLNRINEIYKRTQKDNMHLGVCTDCPHRERGPYTGDGQVSCVAVMHNFDANILYRKWLRDMNDCQNVETGYVPNGAPWHQGCGGGPAWGAAMNIIPWEHYMHYGDITVLQEHFVAMQEQLRYMLGFKQSDGTINILLPVGEEPRYWMNLGEWSPPGPFPKDDLVHTYFAWRCADCLVKTAQALGDAAVAASAASERDSLWQSFHRVYYKPAAADGTNNRSSYGQFGDDADIFALAMGLPEDRYEAVTATIRSDIEALDGHLNTGIFGTQLFFETLCDNGMNDFAYAAMVKTTKPSYGWWVAQGANTFWEDWDGHQSRNHPMFGGGLVWLYRRLAGLDSDTPGYRHIIFRPTPAGDIKWASYSTITPYGEAAIHWSIQKDNSLKVKTIVPKGCTATLILPDGSTYELNEGKHKTLK